MPHEESSLNFIMLATRGNWIACYFSTRDRLIMFALRRIQGTMDVGNKYDILKYSSYVATVTSTENIKSRVTIRLSGWVRCLHLAIWRAVKHTGVSRIHNFFYYFTDNSIIKRSTAQLRLNRLRAESKLCDSLCQAQRYISFTYTGRQVHRIPFERI